MKVIYMPKGAAREYAKYAFNGFVGCSGGCDYCYNKKGITSKVLGKEGATLRKCFKDESDAISKFNKEIHKNHAQLKEHGIFFSFVGDPLSVKTKDLYFECMDICLLQKIKPTFLTKQVDWIKDFDFKRYLGVKNEISFGFTLTGMDELEQGCAMNVERIEALKLLHKKGFNTWVSLEPCISLKESLKMFILSNKYVKTFKIGLESGKKYNPAEVKEFVNIIKTFNAYKSELIFKQSIQKYL